MIPIYTITALMALGVQAFFTSTEMAFTSVNRIRLKGLLEEGDARARKLNEFLTREGMFLGTTLVGTNISVVVASTLMTRVFAEYVGSEVLPVVTTAVMVPATLLFAEIIPKKVARHSATSLALYTVYPLSGFFRVFKPIIVAVNAAARFILSPFKGGSAAWDVTFTKSDLKTLIVSGHEAGQVEKGEVELIHKVLDFGGKAVKDVMIPLYRVSSISDQDSVEDLKRTVSLTGFSRIPIYSGSKNNITGIVNIYDILFDPDEKATALPINDFIREPVHIDQEDGIDIALARLRHRKQPMGIVIDPSGGVTGIITIEDILEEIVGNIEDTF